MDTCLIQFFSAAFILGQVLYHFVFRAVDSDSGLPLERTDWSNRRGSDIEVWHAGGAFPESEFTHLFLLIPVLL